MYDSHRLTTNSAFNLLTCQNIFKPTIDYMKKGEKTLNHYSVIIKRKSNMKKSMHVSVWYIYTQYKHIDFYDTHTHTLMYVYCIVMCVYRKTVARCCTCPSAQVTVDTRGHSATVRPATAGASTRTPGSRYPGHPSRTGSRTATRRLSTPAP